jgi:hypothetical protein
MSNPPIITKDEEIRSLKKQNERLREKLAESLEIIVKLKSEKRRCNP